MPELLLRTQDLQKEYRKQTRSLIAVNQVNLEVRQGQTLGLVGESGSGKTTLVRMMAKLEEPTSGEIYLGDRPYSAMTKREVWENRRDIQMVFQDPGGSFNPKMRVKDILTEVLMNYGKIKKADRLPIAKKLLKQVDLDPAFVGRYPHQLSGGQKQRLSIARALSIEPKILLCDEATSALDVASQAAIIDLLCKLQAQTGVAIVFICHDLALVQNFAHKLAVLYHGNLVESLDAKDLEKRALHPYTKKLLNSVFSLDKNPDPSLVDLPIENLDRSLVEGLMEENSMGSYDVNEFLHPVAPGHWVASR